MDFIMILLKINMLTIQDYSSLTLIVWWMKSKRKMFMKILVKNVYEDFSKDKKMFDFSNYSAKSKYYDDSKKSVVGKVKNETASIAIK